jgi:hypothetical protein
MSTQQSDSGATLSPSRWSELSRGSRELSLASSPKKSPLGSRSEQVPEPRFHGRLLTTALSDGRSDVLIGMDEQTHTQVQCEQLVRAKYSL